MKKRPTLILWVMKFLAALRGSQIFGPSCSIRWVRCRVWRSYQPNWMLVLSYQIGFIENLHVEWFWYKLIHMGLQLILWKQALWQCYERYDVRMCFSIVYPRFLKLNCSIMNLLMTGEFQEVECLNWNVVFMPIISTYMCTYVGGLQNSGLKELL